MDKTPEQQIEHYTLTCDRCGEAFYSKEGFPSPQLCPKCLLVEKVARELCESDGHTWGLTSIPFMHKKYIAKAKQILFENDLYFKVARGSGTYIDHNGKEIKYGGGYRYILLKEVGRPPKTLDSLMGIDPDKDIFKGPKGYSV